MLNLVSHNRGVWYHFCIYLVFIITMIKCFASIVYFGGYTTSIHLKRRKEWFPNVSQLTHSFPRRSPARRGAELFLLFLSSRIQPPSLLCDNPSQKNPTLDILTFLHLLQKYLGLRSGVPRNPFCLLAILISPFWDHTLATSFACQFLA